MPSASADSPASFRKLLRLSLPEWRTLALASLFLVIGSGMGLAYPQAIAFLIDGALTADGGREAIDRAALTMLGIFVVQGVAIGLRHVLFTYAGERIVTRLRERLFAQLVVQEIGFFDGRRSGELLNRLASDTTVLQGTVSSQVSVGLRSLAMVVGGLALLFYTSPALTLVMLVVVPPVALGAVIYGRRIRRLSKDVQDALAGSSEVAAESLAGIRTVRAFAREDQEAGRYARAVRKALGLAQSRAVATGIFSAAASIAAYGAVASVLWYGGRLVLDEAMSVGELTSFILYTLIVAFSLGALGGLWADFMRASGAAARVFGLLERAPSIPTRGGRVLPALEGRVRFEAVGFAYPTRPDVPVLRELSLVLEAGEAVALVGPSGGGKSTIAALISRFYDPDAGRVLLDGVPLTELDPSWLREQIGVVAQEPILFSTSIAENIRYGRPQASLEEVHAAARAANAAGFIEDFPDGYATAVGERGVQLSGGQKQRVAIARAVLKDPRILILDEATSALDAESEALVKEALERLMQNRTTLIIAHRLSTVKDADQVLVVEAGRIVQRGLHARLMEEEGVYRRLLERQRG